MTESEQDRREFVEHCQEIVEGNPDVSWFNLYRWLDQAMEGALEPSETELQRALQQAHEHNTSYSERLKGGKVW